MHPIERLRYVARASGAPADDIVQEAAASLAGFADDPTSLVTACRRLLDRHPANGPVWWLCARVLTAPDPAEEAWRCLDEHQGDPTATELGHALPDGARVAVIGWPERLTAALARRGDLAVRVIDVEGDGPGLVRALERFEVPVDDVEVTGLAAAVADSELLVVDGAAVGPDTVLAPSGSWAAAAVARSEAVPVWVVAGVGRVLPSGTWPGLVRRLGGAATAPWDHEHDRLPLGLVDQLVGIQGPEAVAEGLRRADVPDVPELRR